MENQKNIKNDRKNLTHENDQKIKDGLDKWNDRLDENLETEAHNDEIADEKAKEFSEKLGSGDQSDES